LFFFSNKIDSKRSAEFIPFHFMVCANDSDIVAVFSTRTAQISIDSCLKNIKNNFL